MVTKNTIAVVLTGLALGGGTAAAVGGCGEDRGSVDVEGGTTGSTVGTTTTPETTGTTETGSSGSGY